VVVLWAWADVTTLVGGSGKGVGEPLTCVADIQALHIGVKVSIRGRNLFARICLFLLSARGLQSAVLLVVAQHRRQVYLPPHPLKRPDVVRAILRARIPLQVHRQPGDVEPVVHGRRAVAQVIIRCQLYPFFYGKLFVVDGR